MLLEPPEQPDELPGAGERRDASPVRAVLSALQRLQRDERHRGIAVSRGAGSGGGDQACIRYGNGAAAERVRSALRAWQCAGARQQPGAAVSPTVFSAAVVGSAERSGDELPVLARSG